MNNYTIIIPFYKTGKMMSYCLHQILEYSKGWNVNIIVGDNGDGVGLEYLTPYLDKIKLITYPTDKYMQSHGILFDYVISSGLVKTEYFITLESDSFPTKYNYLSYYDQLIEEGYDMGASLLKLSGGTYNHPAGGFYKKSNWFKCKALVDKYCEAYKFYPNMLVKDGHPCHTMIRREYQHGYSDDDENNLLRYMPIAMSVFHNGMGFNQESILTYGQRTPESEVSSILMPHELPDIIYRLGYEPGQFFSYWHRAVGLRVMDIPTEVVWMSNRVNQQQEFTMTDNGIKHLWSISAYHGNTDQNLLDITTHKSMVVEELYKSII